MGSHSLCQASLHVRGICQDKSFQMPLITPIVRLFSEDQIFSRIPLWISGKHFVTELAHLFKAFETEHTLEAFAMKTAITLPVLRLKTPHAKSKVHDHILSPTLTHIMEKERHTRYLWVVWEGMLKNMSRQHVEWKAANYAMVGIFAEEDTEAIIMANATNAFNRLNN